MCTIFLAYKLLPGLPLVLASNRDEYYARPSQSMSFWQDAPHVLAGRDLKAGGTWLGVNHHGRLAAVTNYRQIPETQGITQSRGLLTASFLDQQPPIESFCEELEAKRDHYPGFNLLFGSLNEGLYYFSNRANGHHKLKPGIYGLSNHLIDTPWPKVKNGKALLESWAPTSAAWTQFKLFRLLSDKTIAEDHTLPDTGVGLEWERRLSATFIESKAYGTRYSTVLRFYDDARVQAEEWCYSGVGAEPKKQAFSLALRP